MPESRPPSAKLIEFIYYLCCYCCCIFVQQDLPEKHHDKNKKQSNEQTELPASLARCCPRRAQMTARWVIVCLPYLGKLDRVGAWGRLTGSLEAQHRYTDPRCSERAQMTDGRPPKRTGHRWLPEESLPTLKNPDASKRDRRPRG